MTKITRPVVRETPGRINGEPLIATLHGKYLLLRKKGSREDPVSWDLEKLYRMGMGEREF